MPLEYQAILNAFNRAANHYEENAVLQKEILYRMSERLEMESLQDVKSILDLACGTGWASEYFFNLYPQAQIKALDFSENMLEQLPKDARIQPLLSDMHDLPFSDHQFDLVFSNMALHWSNEADVLRESLRTLKPGGLLLMSCLGETSLFELKESLQSAGLASEVHSFPKLHALGDELVKSGFEDVVVNTEVITLTYKDLKSLLKDIKASGGQNAYEDRNKGLLTPNQLEALTTAYEAYRNDERLPASYEVIYLRANKPKLEDNAIPLNMK